MLFLNISEHLKELENRSIEILSSGFERIPQLTKKLTEEQQEEELKLIEKIEADNDVQNVYHAMDIKYQFFLL